MKVSFSPLLFLSSSAHPSSTLPYIIPLLILLLSNPLVACRRSTEESRGQTNRVDTELQIPGFIVGQVATRPGAETDNSLSELSDANVGLLFRESLVQTPPFQEEPGIGPTINFQLTWSIARGSATPPPAPEPVEEFIAEAAYVILFLQAEGSAEQDNRFEFEIQGLYRERLVANETPDNAIERLLSNGIDDLIQGLQDEAIPRCATNIELTDQLANADTSSDQLLATIREVYRRRISGSEPVLRDLLRREEIDIIMAAASTLGRLRDADSVDPLIDLISRYHRELAPSILPIIAQIGTTEAALYLQTIAESHEDSYIRDLARELIEQSRLEP
jgi:hypothetical protein